MGINILFVCTGNTCRSPMAAGLLKHLLEDRNKQSYVITSAGTHTLPGMPASAHAIQVMQEQGIDISTHKSAVLDGNISEKADLILALTNGHADFIRDHFPASTGKTFVLSEYARKTGNPTDIADPAGGDLEDYRKTRDQIQEYLKLIVNKM